MSTSSAHSVHALYDSGASQHLFNDKRVFSNYRLISNGTKISGIQAESKPLVPVGEGDVIIRTKTGLLTLRGALHVPGAAFNLISDKRLKHLFEVERSARTLDRFCLIDKKTKLADLSRQFMKLSFT